MTEYLAIRFPTAISEGSTGGPAFKTTVVETTGGDEQRNRNWSKARSYFNAAPGVKTAAQMVDFRNFFLVANGKAFSWRFKDFGDFTSAADHVGTPTFLDQTIGTGTGALLTFQLSKTYAVGAYSYVRTITRPVSGTVILSINGVQKLPGDGTYPWSVNVETGLITFSAAAPPNTELVKAGFEFDVLCRFNTDEMSPSWLEADLQALADIPIVEVREC